MRKVYYIVNLGHARVTLVALVDKSRTNVTKMTGNPAYATPKPTLATIATAADCLDTAIQAYDFSRSRLDKEERDIAFEGLKSLRTDLGGYVQAESNGDQELITSAGFDTEKARHPLGKLGAPPDVLAKALPYPGQVEVRFGGVRGRVAYQVQICSGDPKVEADWSLCGTTSKTRLLVEGLETDKVYYFRAVTLGAAGYSPVSDMTSAKAA